MDCNRIRISGGSGSGKTRLGNKISKYINVEFTQMDRLRYDFSKTTRFVNKKSNEEMIGLLKDVLKRKSWIIEGSYYTISKQSYADADLVILLKVGLIKRLYNTTKRFFNRMKSGNYEGLFCFINLTIYNISSFNKWKEREKLFKKLYGDKLVVFNSADEAFKWFVKNC